LFPILQYFRRKNKKYLTEKTAEAVKKISRQAPGKVELGSQINQPNLPRGYALDRVPLSGDKKAPA